MAENLTLVIQKPDGRLAEPSIKLLSDADLAFRVRPRVDFAYVEGSLPMQIWLRRNASITRDVETGDADFGISGFDMLQETNANVLPILPLGFAKGKVYLGVRNNIPYASVQDLSGKRIFAAYPNMGREYFNKENTVVDLIEEEGSEESLVNAGRGDACIVFSDSGDSIALNNITARETLLCSEAYLIASPTLKEKRGSEKLVERFLRRIVSVLRAREFTYIVMNAPTSTREQIVRILPSTESPTISPLEEPGWLSVASVVPRNQLETIAEALQEVGAKDILEKSIRRMIPNKEDSAIMDMMEKIYD